jgi:hypothetical protein
VEKNAKKCHFSRVFVREKTENAKKHPFLRSKKGYFLALLSVENPLSTQRLPLLQLHTKQTAEIKVTKLTFRHSDLRSLRDLKLTQFGTDDS